MQIFKYKSKTIPWTVEITTSIFEGKEYISYSCITHNSSSVHNRMPDRVAKIMLELIKASIPRKLT